MSDEKVIEILFQKRPENYGSSFQQDLLEMYKIYVTQADAISSRRQTANAYFLSINTALISIFGLTSTCLKSDITRLLCLISIAGMVLSYTWYRLIRSYKGLNSGKYKIIHLIEKELPISPYNAEWEAVGRGKDKIKYLPFTKVEIIVPWVFFSVYVLSIILAFQWPDNCTLPTLK